MPFLWKYCKKGDSKSGYQWCYEDKLCGQYSWAKHYQVQYLLILWLGTGPFNSHM